MRQTGWFDFLKALYKRYQQDEITALSAQMTYYLILSFFPFLIFLITLLTYTPLAGEQNLYALSQLLPDAVYQLVLEIVFGRSITLLSFGMITTLWTSSNGIGAMMKGVNKAYNRKTSRTFLRHRLAALFFTFAFILAVMTTLALLVLGRTWTGYLLQFLGLYSYLIHFWTLLRYTVSLGVMWIFFMILYCFSPKKPFPFRYAWPGATFAVVGWVIISLGFSYYVDHFSRYTYTYGSIGGIFILLAWLYLSSIILLLGAEINGLLSEHRLSADDLH